MNEERRSTRDSRHPHGIAHDASLGATDPMDRFLMQMFHIDQKRTERDEKCQAEEKTRREEQDTRILQRQTEQDQRMAQIMAGCTDVWTVLWTASWTQPIAQKVSR